MSAKQGYKQTDIGEIPEEWGVVRLGTKSGIVGGSTPSTREPTFWNGNIPFVTPSDITALNGKNILSTTKKYITKKGLESISAKLLPKGSILLTSRATIGVCAINNVEVVTNQGFANLIPNEGVDGLWLLYQLRFQRNELKRLASGSTFREVSKSSVKKMKIPLPPASEQQKIASILSTVDETIQKTDAIIREAEMLKRGLMQKLLTRGIGHTQFKQSDIGKIPEEWDVSKLEGILHVCQYGLSVPLSEKGTYPIFRMNNFENGYVVPNDIKYTNVNKTTFTEFKLDKGDILFNRTNSYDLVGKVGIFLLEGEYTFASYLIRLTINRRKANPFFVNYYLNTESSQNRLRRLATRGVSQSNINAKNLKSIKIPLPPLHEQHKIASIISSLDDKLEKEKCVENELEQLKRGLMQVLLTGKVRVRMA